MGKEKISYINNHILRAVSNIHRILRLDTCIPNPPSLSTERCAGLTVGVLMGDARAHTSHDQGLVSNCLV